MKKGCDFSAGSVEGVRKLLVENGSASQFTMLSTTEIIGTDENDSFDFGSYSEIDVDRMDLGAGNDVLKIKKYSDVTILALDFGEGTKDVLSIGKGATLSLDELDVDSLDRLSMDKGATLVIADADDLAAAQEKWSKYSAQIVGPTLA